MIYLTFYYSFLMVVCKNFVGDITNSNPSLILLSPYPAGAKLMNVYATLTLALAMSMDAFAVAISKGATLKCPTLKEAIRIGVIFGTIEALTPLLGWSIGVAASQFSIKWSHWVAFILLSILGLRMILEGLWGDDLKEKEHQQPKRHSFALLVTTAFASSLDALAVGVGLAFLEVNIVLTAFTIGATTLFMTTIGIMLGQFIGPMIGKWAEVTGGVILIGIGFNSLADHLAVFNSLHPSL